MKAASAALDEAVRACEEYRRYMNEEISARSDRLIGQTLGKEALEEFKRGLEALKFKLADCELAVERARSEVKKAEDGEKQAAAMLRDAVLETEKIKAHREIWLASERIEQERAEEPLRRDEMEQGRETQPRDEQQRRDDLARGSVGGAAD
ncbi:MAG: YscO family type III secretion system apparatus protein, partial [Succinivibrio sp.]